jgi:hypothetical protein
MQGECGRESRSIKRESNQHPIARRTQVRLLPRQDIYIFSPTHGRSSSHNRLWSVRGIYRKLFAHLSTATMVFGLFKRSGPRVDEPDSLSSGVDK